MSVSIYDTAWVSKITKNVNGNHEWLFPKSFEFVLERQLENGGWAESSAEAEVDGILNTMSALIALLQHQKEGTKVGNNYLPGDICTRIQKSIACLKAKLNTWNVETTDHVCFEMLVPAHLKLLAKLGITFEFPGYSRLMRLHNKKIAMLDASKMYENKGTFLHSLEAFIGLFDFDKLKNQKMNGSFMSSPASTAAYLIYATEWDDECESYLRMVFDKGQGNGTGGFPSAFPSEIFEVTWILSTLLEAGFTVDELGRDNVATLGNYLHHNFAISNGTLSFTAAEIPDADDTAKSILTLSLLGYDNIDPDKMISKFFDGNHFRTYATERNPSLSANCNVLNGLLHLPNAEDYLPQIIGAAEFLCSAWFSGGTKDKWNLSQEYSNMLLAQSLSKLIQSTITLVPHLQENVGITLAQLLTCTLQTLTTRNNLLLTSSESLSYALLTLTNLSKIPFAFHLHDEILDAVLAGRQVLLREKPNWELGPKLWIEKVSYSSPVIARAYCLSALRAPLFKDKILKVPGAVVDMKMVEKFISFFSTLPVFAGHSISTMKFSLVEAMPFLTYMRRIQGIIFPRKEDKEDRYLQYIPATWTMCNALHDGKRVETNVLKDVMVLSMLNYQADWFMESVVGDEYKGNLDGARELVKIVCGKFRIDGMRNGNDHLDDEAPIVQATYLDFVHAANSMNGNSYSDADTIQTSRKHHIKDSLNIISSSNKRFKPDHSTKNENKIETILTSYASHILTHPSVLASSTSTRTNLLSDFETFLLAHIQQLSDNEDRASDMRNSWKRGSLHTWLRKTGAEHTSCIMSFTFFLCLISPVDKNKAFMTEVEKYLAEDLRLHLAAMCRLYNDLGSINRDCEEGNLNCVDFFPGDESLEHRKLELQKLAEYERECLGLAWEKLKREGLQGGLEEALGLFIDVTDLYGQIYVTRDIGITVKK
ncbi:hypothetical protein BGZ60DRAFT_442141 [Tricladium varicosporioides]|nr:hypothetical protein BGZ60DRAFT_442141 [Hymenoscyphus varicosporioides]